MKTNVSSDKLLRRGLRRDQIRVEVIIEELGPRKRMFTPEDLGLSRPKLVGPLIDLVAVAAAAPNGDGNGAAAAAPHHNGAPPPPVVMVEPSPAALAAIAAMERLQANKFLTLLGYKGAEMRDILLAGGDVEEAVAAAAPVAAAPAAAAAANLAPAAGVAAMRMRRLQEQLGLPDPTGALDDDTLWALANRYRYNTYPEKDLLSEYEARTFPNGATVYWSIESPCYMAGTDDDSNAETVMQRCCQQWQDVTSLTFKKARACVDDDHPEADLEVVFIPFKDYDIGPHLEVLNVGPDFRVFPHHLSVVATSDKGLPPAISSIDGNTFTDKGLPSVISGIDSMTLADKGLPPVIISSSYGNTFTDKGLPPVIISSSYGKTFADKGLPPVISSRDGKKQPLPLPLPGRPGAAKIMIDTTWTFWMLPTTPQRVHDFYGAFYLEPLLLHNIGSALGLHSSGRPEDVMCPFYSAEGHTALTDNDKQRARDLYPIV
ncbi:hypothetical protein PLESTB_001732400 [Pleodorina starrii]|uniref:Peptidase M10 metallopeptidase domain-containing protein n=1 Tax=Pleodorina starrii TaxID=330485 RepID=A0A9W6BZY7_9CHLO|nr:hypothetical protein PLESTB_001732400 [Pleodorina starrii]GLC76881.1 hypothetical protein PLESTF_001851200 [Pleodorina starrii]